MSLFTPEVVYLINCHQPTSGWFDSVPFFPATATMELTPGQVSGMINAAVFFGPLAIANVS